MENIEVPVPSGDSQSNSEPIATNVRGTVKWFHRVRGFGFITRDDTKEDIFCHYTSIKPMSINLRKAKKRLNLMDKEKVVFDIVKNKGNLEAINVVGKNGYYIIDIIAYKREIQPYDLEIINDTRVTGKVKWFNVKIKYGFIHCDYNEEDVFVHASAIVKNNPDKYKPSLCEGEPVEFDILKHCLFEGADGKLEAVNVSGPMGANVQGSRYSPDKNIDEYTSASEGDTSTSNKKYVENNLVGKVKWFNVKAGFGFINRNDNGQDVYAHHSAIIKKNPAHSVRSLADGELVQFNIVEGEKGLEAADITGVNGGSVQGSEYAQPSRGERGRARSERSRGGSSVRAQRQPQQRGSQQQGSRRSASGGVSGGRSAGGQQQHSARGQTTRGQRRPAPQGQAPISSASAYPQTASQPARQLQQAPLPPQQPYGDVAPGAYTYFNNRPNRQGMYDSSGRYSGNSQQGVVGGGGSAQMGAGVGNYAAPPAGQPRHNNPGQMQYSSYNPSSPSVNNRSGAGGYMNGAGVMDNAPPPHAFMPAPPQGPPMPQQAPAYDMGNNGAPYYNQRMAPNNYQYQPPSNGNGVLVDQRVQGFVKWYNFKNGFGFVTRSDSNQDIFVHKSGIQATNSSQPSLDDGEPVEFDVYQDGTRLLAINVTGPDGTILRGSKYATSQRTNQRPPNHNHNMGGGVSAATGGGGGGSNAPSKVYHRRKAN